MSVQKHQEGKCHWHHVMSSTHGSAINIAETYEHEELHCFLWVFMKDDTWCVVNVPGEMFRKSFCGTIQLFLKFLFASHPFASIFFPFFLPQRAVEREVECIGGYSSAAGSEPPAAAVPVVSVPSWAQWRCMKPDRMEIIVNSAWVNCVFAGYMSSLRAWSLVH